MSEAPKYRKQGFMVNKRILLLGGAGFIGRNLCQQLQQNGHHLTVIDRVNPQLPNVTFTYGDMNDLQHFPLALLSEVDCIYWLAWSSKPQSANEQPRADLQNNVVAGLALLDYLVQLEQPPRVFFISTGGAMYGATTVYPTPESECPQPIGAYGISKWTFEQYLALYQRLYGLDYLIFRPGNPYGEGQSPQAKQGAVAVFMGLLAQQQPIKLWGDGLVERDYLYIQDLVAALVKALNYFPEPQQARTFNLGSGEGLSLLDLLTAIEATTALSANIHYLPARHVDVPKVALDCQQAKQYLGWQTTTPLAQGLANTWHWIQHTIMQ
ncbi:MAG TPA: NAD-dependent epimerase/dehydratase family protein [Thiothrix sp.]|nr:NAD-dependent epimerase/dehydratase family protein [Thiothrix sp.]